MVSKEESIKSNRLNLLNQPFILWLMSAIFLSAGGYIWKSAEENIEKSRIKSEFVRKEKRRLKTTLYRLNLELVSRIVQYIGWMEKNVVKEGVKEFRERDVDPKNTSNSKLQIQIYSWQEHINDEKIKSSIVIFTSRPISNQNEIFRMIQNNYPVISYTFFEYRDRNFLSLLSEILYLSNEVERRKIDLKIDISSFFESINISNHKNYVMKMRDIRDRLLLSDLYFFDFPYSIPKFYKSTKFHEFYFKFHLVFLKNVGAWQFMPYTDCSPSGPFC